MTKTDFEKGRIDGFCGLEARYPHNINYMSGFDLGNRQLMRDIMLDAPFESMTPSGTNDSHIDCNYC